MIFKNRKLYAHGQKTGLFIMQIPKLVCDTLNLTKDTLIELDFNEADGTMTIKKQEPEQEVVNQEPEE